MKSTVSDQRPQRAIKLVVFDLDGTLVDSMTYFTDVAAQVMHEHFAVGLDEARQMYRDTSGLPFEFQLKQLFALEPRIQQAVTAFETGKLERYADAVFYDDLNDVMTLLKSKMGLHTAVSSNNFQNNVNVKLADHEHLFDRVLGYRDGFFKGRDHFEHLQREFQLQADEILFVGDSLHDCLMARENGVNFVARLGTFTGQEFRNAHGDVATIHQLSELPNEIRAMNLFLTEGVSNCKSSF